MIIVGAGLTGLSVANYLKNAGKKILILDSASEVGGVLTSEKVDGFTLDRGFQVLLSEFPELKQLDIDRFKPKKFYPGVYINLGEEQLKLIADPSRLPKRLFSTLFNGVGSVSDKFKLWSLRQKLKHMSVSRIFQQADMSTADALKSYGFSNSFTEKFIKPFFGGVFLDTELQTSRKMFDFYFKMLCEGTAFLPEEGMESLTGQMAAVFTGYELGLNTNIARIENGKVLLESGMEFTAPIIVVTTTDEVAQGLLPVNEHDFAVNHTFYYKYSNSPFDEPFLAVNGLKGKLINHISVITDVSPNYSFTSDALISVNVVNSRGLADDILTREVKKELKEWFGPEASYWELIRFYKTKKIQLTKVSDTLFLNEVELKPGLFYVPEFSLNGSIDGCFAAGKQVARHITGEELLKNQEELKTQEGGEAVENISE